MPDNGKAPPKRSAKFEELRKLHEHGGQEPSKPSAAAKARKGTRAIAEAVEQEAAKTAKLASIHAANEADEGMKAFNARKALEQEATAVAAAKQPVSTPTKTVSPVPVVPARERFQALMFDGPACAACKSEEADRSDEFPGVCATCKTASDEQFAAKFTEDGAALLDELRVTFERFLSLAKPEYADLLALWTLHSYVYGERMTTPYLNVTSPVRGCGKSMVFKVLALVVRSPFIDVDPTPSATAALIDQLRPTWLCDEIDNLWTSTGTKSSLISILNVGNARGGMWKRKRGKDVELYNLYCPKAFAGIDKGTIPPTIEDRSITLVMHKSKRAKRERLYDRHAGEIAPLTEWAERWAGHHSAAVKAAEPTPEYNDRTQDKWEPLFVLADLAGGEWPKRVRAAAVALTPDEEDDVKEVLLADLKVLFDKARKPAIATDTICHMLAAMDDRPWGAIRSGTAINGALLASMLRSFGVRPSQRRIDGNPTRCWERATLKPLWDEWL